MERVLIDEGFFNFGKDTYNPGIIQLEYSLLEVAAAPAVAQGVFYLFPVLHEGILYVRYLESGIYQGLFPKMIPLLMDAYGVTANVIFPWRVYTCYDLELQQLHRGDTKTPAYRQYVRKVGPEDKSRTNQGSIMSQINNNKAKFDSTRSIVFVHKCRANPNNKSHRYVYIYE